MLSTQCFGGAFKTKCVVTETITGFSDLKRVGRLRKLEESSATRRGQKMQK